MKLRKISANLLFTGKGNFIPNGVVYLDHQNRIVKVKDPGPDFAEESGVEYYNGIITPGFINSHCHIELSHLRSQIDEQKGLENFIHHIINKKPCDPGLIQKAIQGADQEMRREGIVAVGDVSNTRDSFSVKARSPIHYHTFVEVLGLDDKKAEMIFNKGTAILKEAREKYGLVASLVPHSSYAVSEKLFQILREKTKQKDNLLSIHNQESDMDYSEQALRKLFNESSASTSSDLRNSLAYLSAQIPVLASLILVHNLLLGEKDIKDSLLNPDKTYFALCPNSNLYISGKIPGDYLIKTFPDKICLGTDSLASNHRLSILEEMKTLQEAQQVSLELLLQFASVNGAKALQINNIYGEFREGLIPGVNLIQHVDLSRRMLKPESKIKVLA